MLNQDVLDEIKNAAKEYLNSHEQLTDEIVLPVWVGVQTKLANKILEGDIGEFLQWHIIRRTMSTGRAGHILFKLKFLQNLPDWEKRWRQAIQVDDTGTPDRLKDFPETTGALINAAYHVAQTRKHTGKNLWEHDYIFEFGGGFGAMCQVIYQLGFEGQYLIYDLPMSHTLQFYYLQESGWSSNDNRIYGMTELEDIPRVTKDWNMNQAAFIATMSLTEAPFEMREAVYPYFKDMATILMAFATEFYDIQNTDFMLEWGNRFINRGYHVEISLIDQRPGKNYFFAWLKELQESPVA